MFRNTDDAKLDGYSLDTRNTDGAECITNVIHIILS